MPCRRFEDFEYRTRKSRSRARRVVGKAEILTKGKIRALWLLTFPLKAPREPNERFAARPLYEKLYCARGEMENRIKEAQQDLFADRTSTSWMASNQLRLWFSALPISCSQCCGPRCCAAPIWPRPPSARSGSNSSRSVPASRSVVGA